MAWSLSTLKGQNAERQAEAFLRKKGLKLVDRNFKKPFGEIDLIMQDGNTLVFIEVRSRSTGNLASPEETIDRNKQRRIIKVAKSYLQNYPLTPCRFDVVGIVGQDIYWIPNAFFANDR
jgi:putative endonuclease